MTGSRRTVDLCAVGLALAVSLFLVLVGVASRDGLSIYFLAIGAVGSVCFGPNTVDAYWRRPISRAHRVFVAVSAFVLGVLTGSVVLLPARWLVTLGFAVTAVFPGAGARP